MTASPPDSSRSPSGASDPKRRALLGAAAAAAALLGVGTALWRSQTSDTQPSAPPVEGLWSLQWETPQGGTLAMQALRGRPLLLNFWATWCTPCIEELPLINDFYLKNRANGWQVLGLALDKRESIQAFLQRTPVAFPIGMAGLSGAELGRGLGNLAGGLPFSVVFGSDGMVAQRKMGRLAPADLTAWLGLK